MSNGLSVAHEGKNRFLTGTALMGLRLFGPSVLHHAASLV